MRGSPARASKKAKGVMLDELCVATGWSRVNARRAIHQTANRKGPAGQVKWKPRQRKYSCDGLKVLEHVWTLDGEPCGKYLALGRADPLVGLVWFSMLELVTFASSYFFIQVMDANGFGVAATGLIIVIIAVMCALALKITIPLLALAATVIEVTGMGLVSLTKPLTSGLSASVVALVGFAFGAGIRKLVGR